MPEGRVQRGRSQVILSVALCQDKMVQTETHQIVRKNCFIVRVVEHCIRLPREVLESPPLEICKTQLEMVLDNQF